MKCLIVIAGVIAVASLALAAVCPDGSPIYELGISENGKADVVAAHNKYRKMIADGTVPNQPRGKNIQMIGPHDDRLAMEARKVSNTCRMNHIIAQDSRWSWVGQNLLITWSSENTGGQDWYGAVASWYAEHKYFTYPDHSSGETGHYTQLIWATSNTIGCDFVRFYDNRDAFKPYPYAKLYTCNYGPGGNYVGMAPYEKA